ncbi:hypothetical protein [Kordiimonas sediminis]|uniref:hypothetical protein n=1 Tax=Kordiimonas sediminis TaxID=1735581 RepID=UPI001748D3D0|nr:hypothetical protein [Kordiimonas sediminis]
MDVPDEAALIEGYREVTAACLAAATDLQGAFRDTIRRTRAGFEGLGNRATAVPNSPSMSVGHKEAGPNDGFLQPFARNYTGSRDMPDGTVDAKPIARHNRYALYPAQDHGVMVLSALPMVSQSIEQALGHYASAQHR